MTQFLPSRFLPSLCQKVHLVSYNTLSVRAIISEELHYFREKDKLGLISDKLSKSWIKSILSWAQVCFLSNREGLMQLAKIAIQLTAAILEDGLVVSR